MTNLRKRIAERLVEAQHSTASLTTFNEVNLQKVVDLRSLAPFDDATVSASVRRTGRAIVVHEASGFGGYGAEAVHPYLALETLLSFNPAEGKKAIKNFVKAIGKGLRKVMSKMGISTYMSYTGAQI